jgi:hypothetical protein
MSISDSNKLQRRSGNNIILDYITCAFVLCAISGIILLSSSNLAIAAENSKSVTLRGYTFTLADDSWLTYPKIDTASGCRWCTGSASEYDITANQMIKNYWIGWHGQVLENAFYLPDERCEGKPSCFNDEDYDKDGNCPGCWPYEPKAFVAIYVLDKINASELTEKSVLKEASMLSNSYIFADLLENKASEKDITFDDRPAHLIEDGGMATMSVDLSPDKVAVIDVDYHDGNPWYDVLDKITISK